MTTTLLDRLCRASRPPAHARLPWLERTPLGEWCVSPELISLFGTPTYEALSEAERKRLSFFEAVNFFSLNIHGERRLVAGLAERLYRRAGVADDAYLHHFLDEENQHMACFGEFCARYAGKVYAERKLSLGAAPPAGTEEFLFFARVLIFEEMVDAYNAAMARDARLAPIARAINRYHHKDESRHLAFGRAQLGRLWEREAQAWAAETRAFVRDDLRAYMDSAWAEYFNPDVYRDAGLQDPYALREQALAGVESRNRRRRVTRRLIELLARMGALEEVRA